MSDQEERPQGTPGQGPYEGGWQGYGGGNWPPPPREEQPGYFGGWGSGWGGPPGYPPHGGYPGYPPGYHYQPPPPPRRRRLPAILTAMLVVVAAAAGVGIGHAVWTNYSASNATGQSPTSGLGGSGLGGGSYFQSPSSGGAGSGSTSSGSGSPADVGAIAAKVDPALVDINDTFSYQQVQGAGTGIVLTSNGEILTNNHVIDGATSISVTDIGNHKTYGATVVGYDKTDDVAILQLKHASGLTTAKIDTSKTHVGEGVVAIGNAGGRGGTPTSAGGSITALDQSITASDQLDGTSEQLSGLIQVNADIQSGDSGGSLVNSAGKVIGMDTAAQGSFSFSPAGNQGYAIPINKAMSIAKQIESGTGTATVHVGPTAFLGVLVSATSSSSGSQFGGSGALGGGSTTAGAPIAGVVSGGAAQKAGLGQGDVITALGGHSIDSSSALTEALVPYHPGDKVSLSWVDPSGQSHTATVTLASGPPA